MGTPWAALRLSPTTSSVLWLASAGPASNRISGKRIDLTYRLAVSIDTLMTFSLFSDKTQDREIP